MGSWWDDYFAGMNTVGIDAAGVPDFGTPESALVTPTVDPIAAAQADYVSGKITQEELTSFVGDINAINTKTDAQIKADTAAIAEKYSYGNLYGKPLLAAGGAITDTVKNLLALALVAAALYLLTKGKELAA
jgi:hypothetical protein